MAISIRHKTLVFLGFMLLALGLVGCGDSGPSQAEFEALEQELITANNKIAALETAQGEPEGLMEKIDTNSRIINELIERTELLSQTRPTYTPLPTYTPAPTVVPTPLPTSTATPLPTATPTLAQKDPWAWFDYYSQGIRGFTSSLNSKRMMYRNLSNLLILSGLPEEIYDLETFVVKHYKNPEEIDKQRHLDMWLMAAKGPTTWETNDPNMETYIRLNTHLNDEDRAKAVELMVSIVMAAYDARDHAPGATGFGSYAPERSDYKKRFDSLTIDLLLSGTPQSEALINYYAEGWLETSSVRHTATSDQLWGLIQGDYGGWAAGKADFLK